MKKNLKRWIAFLLAVVLIAGTCVYSSDAFLRADGGDGSEPAAEYVESRQEMTVVSETGELTDRVANEVDDGDGVYSEEEEAPKDDGEDPDGGGGDSESGNEDYDDDGSESSDGSSDGDGNDSESDGKDLDATGGDGTEGEDSSSESSPEEEKADLEEGDNGSADEDMAAFGYIVSFYYDGVEDENARVSKADKSPGESILSSFKIRQKKEHNGKDYVLDYIENEGGVITEDTDRNMVKVYYVSEEKRTEAYSLKFGNSPLDGGRISVVSLVPEDERKGGLYEVGTEITFKVSVNEGYELISVQNKDGEVLTPESGDGNSREYIYMISITEDIDITAYYEKAEVKEESEAPLKAAGRNVSALLSESDNVTTTAYFYLWKPEAQEGEDYRTAWIYVGSGDVEGPRPVKENDGNKYALSYMTTIGYPSSYEPIVVDGKTYTYSESENRPNTYYVVWDEAIVSNGYNIGNVGHSVGYCYHVNGHVVLKNEEVCTVTFKIKEPNAGGYVNAGDPIAVTKGGAVSALSMTNRVVDGITYHFDGWYKNESCTEKAGGSDFSDIQQNVTFYGKYAAEDVTLTYDANEGLNSPGVFSYPAGATVSVEGPGGMQREGYGFSGWNTQKNGNGSAYLAGDKIHLTADTVLYAQWTQNEYTITYVWADDTPDMVKDNPDFRLPDREVIKYGEPYEASAKTYDAAEAKDLYGNVTTKYIFTGWSPEKISEVKNDAIISGHWREEKITPETYSAKYTWDLPGNVTLYEENGKEAAPRLPADITDLVNNQPYGTQVDTAYTKDTVYYTHDDYGNASGQYSFSGWTYENDGKINGKDAEITGSWTYAGIQVKGYKLVYEWKGAPDKDTPGIKEEEAPELPKDTLEYVKGQGYKIDATYSKDFAVNTYDRYGNINGVYKFSGWTDPNTGTMGDSDVHITGSWSYAKEDVARHNVIYKWNLPATASLYDENGDIIAPQRPETIPNLVKGQEYALDEEYKEGTVFYTHDGYGNRNGSYTFEGWIDPNGGKMGESDVEVSGNWKKETIPVGSFKVTYSWSGNIPGEAISQFPETEKEYVPNQQVTVTAISDVPGYTFSGWRTTENSNVTLSDTASFNMPANDVVITGTRSADFSDIKARGIVKTYDGKEESITLSGTLAGDSVAYSAGGKPVQNAFKNAGVSVVDVTVSRGTESYALSGTVMITPKEVRLKSADLTKEYTGEEFTKQEVTVENGYNWAAGEEENIEYLFTGKQKLIGSSENTFAAVSRDKEKVRMTNYLIKYQYGQLTVTGDSVKDNAVVSKKHTGGEYEEGAVVPFTITVTNIYDEEKTIIVEEQTGVIFAGQPEGVNTYTFENVGPGESREVEAYYTITRADAYREDADADAGYTNTVKVRFEDGEKEFEDTDSVDVARLYRLNIQYLYTDGREAADQAEEYLKEGEGYTFYSPQVDGFTAEIPFITGTMTAKDRKLIVYYSAIPAVAPETETSPEPTETPGLPEEGPEVTVDDPAEPAPPVTPTDNEPAPALPDVPDAPDGLAVAALPDGAVVVALPAAAGAGGLVAIEDENVPLGVEVIEDEDGNITFVPITEDEIPLDNRKLDDHKCCILSFLLMLAAMLIYTWFTHSMKKRQRKLAELKDHLAEEMLKRQHGTTHTQKGVR